MGPIQPLVEMAPGYQKVDKIQWRDISSNNQKLLWEENLDKDDLVNLTNPSK
jgi:hypothetical protein